MTKQKNDLSKCFRVCRNYDDLLKLLAHDIEKRGKKFSDLANKNFNLMNPWDQTVLANILTNMLACIEVNVELDGDNMEKSIRDFYEMHLEGYRSQLREKVLN